MDIRDEMRRGLALGLLLGACFSTVACGDSSPPPAGEADAGVPAGDAGSVQPEVCDVQAPTSCASPAPRYADVAPIFEQRCVTCHDAAPGGPWPLTDYGHIADWEDSVRSSQLDCSMPPADSGVPITREERLAILQWIRCGMQK